jgi:hypothetical protein
VLAGRGRLNDAAGLADEAVMLAAQTDYLNEHAAALEDLAHVHGLAGRNPDARLAREAALELYRRKGNAVCAVRLERLVADHAPA